jgi:hypothetical protein
MIFLPVSTLDQERFRKINYSELKVVKKNDFSRGVMAPDAKFLPAPWPDASAGARVG